MNQKLKQRVLTDVGFYIQECQYDLPEGNLVHAGARVAMDKLEAILAEDTIELEGNVSAEQLDPLRLMADTLETKLQALRDQQQDHNERSRNYAVLFEAAKQATKLKLLIAAALLNVKNNY